MEDIQTGSAPQPQREDKIAKHVFEALGEVSALFMSSEEKGINIVMPSEEIKRIGDNLIEWIEEYYG